MSLKPERLLNHIAAPVASAPLLRGHRREASTKGLPHSDLLEHAL
jgi:hypothetical protein